MPRSKATQVHVRSKVIDVSQSGKSNSQALGVQWITVNFLGKIQQQYKTTHQGSLEDSSQICQKISWWSKKTFVKIFCWLKRQKRNFFELCYIWCKPYVTANMSIKHGGGTEEETSGQTKACTSVHLLLKQKESCWLLFTCMWALVKWVHIACCSNVIVCEHLCIFENDFL